MPINANYQYPNWPFWQVTKPDGLWDQNCGYHALDNHPLGSPGAVIIDDAPCDHMADGWCGICQRNPCDPGWTFFNNHCYKPLCPTGGFTHEDAEQACIAEGAYLALPITTEQHEFVYGLDVVFTDGLDFCI